MPRPRQRACLQDGLKLDLNCLIRQRSVRPGAISGPYLLQWTNKSTGEVVGSGVITSNLCDRDDGWFRLEANGIDQRIMLVARPRHFGGVQWYFVCPIINRRASVLWMLPGARQFFSRHAWGWRKVASISVPRGSRPRLRGSGKDQGALDRRARSGRMAPAAETEMDAMAYIQSISRTF